VVTIETLQKQLKKRCSYALASVSRIYLFVRNKRAARLLTEREARVSLFVKNKRAARLPTELLG